ncbi:hypothetical protein M427DRAFT_39382 [Gonapodya prolifera JEL478]|uniref:Uncharacterized protein n=1 Tax=Gonapodya prolifera (strain JEL478) TaxID=1344416 RepID=A0A138ZXH7_GONPJ|nr:hypothetical protein M427DRAFT_39382 [Gonapodya prolifera JEL478]|eukprot:KXS09206.1 hypothetical protein M427DRAFT_39382 [Gonapodya prolifera JEL478]
MSTQSNTAPNRSILDVLKRNHTLLWKLAEIAFDVAVPLALYYILINYVSRPVALIVSGVPPLLRSLFKYFWARKTDYILIIIFISFVASAIMGLTTNDARLVLLDNAVTTGCIALLFLFTLVAPINPLAYTLMHEEIPIQRIKQVAARVTTPEAAASTSSATTALASQEHDQIAKDEDGFPTPDPDYVALYYAENPAFKRDCVVLTAFVGVLLVIECAGLIGIIFGSPMDVDGLVIATRIYGWVTTSVVIAGAMIYTFVWMRRTSLKGLVTFVAGFRKGAPQPGGETEGSTDNSTVANV